MLLQILRMSVVALCLTGHVIAEQFEHQFLIFPPYWSQDSSGQYSGYHYALAQRLYEDAGLDVALKEVPYKRMQLQIPLGEVAFINYGDVEGINTNDIVHVCVPPTLIKLNAYYLEGTEPAMLESDFQETRVGLVRGLPLGSFEVMRGNPDIRFIEVSTVVAGLRMLSQKRVNYFITFENTVDTFIKTLDRKSAEKIRSTTLTSLNGYPIVSPKSNPRGEALCNQVREAYDRLVASGEIDPESKLLKQ